MGNARWRGRLATLVVAGTALLTSGGCSGLSDQQLSSILQTVITSALTTLVNAFVTGLAGTA